jgi:hypothetical protein
VTLSRSRQSGGLYDAPDTVSRISPDALIIAPSSPALPLRPLISASACRKTVEIARHRRQ